MNTTAGNTRVKLTAPDAVSKVEEFYRKHDRLPKRGDKIGGVEVGNRLQYLRRKYDSLDTSLQTRLRYIGVRPSQVRSDHMQMNLIGLANSIIRLGFDEATKTNSVSFDTPTRNIGRFLIGLRERMEKDFDSEKTKSDLELMRKWGFIVFRRDGFNGNKLVLSPAPDTSFVENASGLIGEIIDVPSSPDRIVTGTLEQLVPNEDGTKFSLLIHDVNDRRILISDVSPLGLVRHPSLGNSITR